MTKEDQVKSAVEQTVERFGRMITQRNLSQRYSRWTRRSSDRSQQLRGHYWTITECLGDRPCGLAEDLGCQHGRLMAMQQVRAEADAEARFRSSVSNSGRPHSNLQLTIFTVKKADLPSKAP